MGRPWIYRYGIPTTSHLPSYRDLSSLVLVTTGRCEPPPLAPFLPGHAHTPRRALTGLTFHRPPQCCPIAGETDSRGATRRPVKRRAAEAAGAEGEGREGEARKAGETAAGGAAEERDAAAGR